MIDRWLPIWDIAFWNDFKKRFPESAESMYQRAERALYGENAKGSQEEDNR